MGRLPWRQLVTGLLLAGLLSGCGAVGKTLAPEHEWLVLNRPLEPAYDELFPHYAELCAVSQFRPLESRPGGIPGHAVMYLRGACIDPAAAYPRLKMCDPEAGDDDLSHGVGVSVNRWFKNINWMATPGKSFFFRGDLEPEDRLNREHEEATLRRAVELGLYRGVEFHEYPTDAAERTLEDFILRHSMGTDYALNFGRTLTCSVVPVTPAMMESIVSFLNGLNDEYARGTAEYNWSGYSDNCVHAVRNALAAADVWAPKPVHEIKKKHALQLAIPANEFVELAVRTGEFPIEDFDRVYADAVARAGLKEYGWLPGRHGAVLETLHAHQWNDLYDSTYRLLGLQNPVSHGLFKKAQAMEDDARLVELETNLRFFQTRYREILEKERAGGSSGEKVKDKGYYETRSRYVKYVEEELADVTEKLERLMEIRRRQREQRGK
jgi:hypothetical protein